MSVNNTYSKGLLVACNVINVAYHLPQIIKTYRTKSVKDFDAWYLFLSITHSFCWVLYGIEENNPLMIFNTSVTIFAVSFISYYKFTAYISNLYNLKNTKEHIKEATKEHIKEATKEHIKEATKEHIEEATNPHKVITVSTNNE